MTEAHRLADALEGLAVGEEVPMPKPAFGWPEFDFDGYSDSQMQAYGDARARAAIAALEEEHERIQLMLIDQRDAARAAHREGFALVPLVPTVPMLQAGVKAFQHAWTDHDNLAYWRAFYKAAIAAAP